MTTDPSAPESRNPFQSGRFVRWWLASLVAGTGIGIQAVTVPLFIRDRVDVDERALAISAALIAQSLPGALLALFGGAVADRMEHRRILLRTYGVAAAVSVAYVFLAGLDVRVIWPVFFLAAAVGSAGAFTNPARQAMLPQIVTQPQLQNGVIFGTMGFMATLQFLGPTVGGITTELAGITIAFGLEFVLLVLAAVFFSQVRTERPVPSGRSVAADLVEGLRYVRARPVQLSLVSLASVPGVVFIGPFAVTVPIVVPDVFLAGDKWVGILWGCFGAGVFLCSIVLSLWPLRRRGFAVCATLIVGGAVLIAYGATETLWTAALLLFFWGCSAAVFINYVVALLQQHTEPRMMGRVMSMYSLAFFAASPIGYLQSGLLTSAFGPQVTLLSNGAAAVAMGVASLAFLKAVRQLE